MTDHLWSEIANSGYILCYAWQDGELFRVNLRRQGVDGLGDFVCGGIGHTFDDALEQAASEMDNPEFIRNESKATTWSIDSTPEASLAARLGIGKHTPIVRRF